MGESSDGEGNRSSGMMGMSLSRGCVVLSGSRGVFRAFRFQSEFSISMRSTSGACRS